MSRHHVPPPDSAPATNVAPGREWMMLPSEEYEESLPPALPREVDGSLSNTTRLLIAEQLFSRYLAEGQDAEAARVLADARALQMVP